MRTVHYQFRLSKDNRGEVKSTYIGLTDIVKDEPIAYCDSYGNCAYNKLERKGYSNWYLEFPDMLYLDLLHHELIKDSRFEITIGDPDSDYYQSSEREEYPKSLGYDYGFLEKIGDTMTKELTKYLAGLEQCIDQTTSLVVKWDYKKDKIEVEINKIFYPYE